MKKILKNKKGFTLVELLAVIVVLAVIMVIAVQQINKTIQRARANSMISSLNMAVKGAKTKLVDGSLVTCIGSSTNKCLDDVIEYDNEKEYTISVQESYVKYSPTVEKTVWKVTLTALSNGQFDAADFDLVPASSKKNINIEKAKKGAGSSPRISITFDLNTGSIQPTTTTTK